VHLPSRGQTARPARAVPGYNPGTLVQRAVGAVKELALALAPSHLELLLSGKDEEEGGGRVPKSLMSSKNWTELPKKSCDGAPG